LIAYFLGNICAKNYRNRTVYVKIIANQSGTFFERQCTLHIGIANTNDGATKNDTVLTAMTGFYMKYFSSLYFERRQ